MGGGWKDPGTLKFVPTCMWDKRLRIQGPDGAMRNSAFRVRQMPSVMLTCSQNPDPPTMRVPKAAGSGQEILDEADTTHTRTDHLEAA